MTKLPTPPPPPSLFPSPKTRTTWTRGNLLAHRPAGSPATARFQDLNKSLPLPELLLLDQAQWVRLSSHTDFLQNNPEFLPQQFFPSLTL